MNDDLTLEQLAVINAPVVNAPVAQSAAQPRVTSVGTKKSRIRPAVQNRRAHVANVVAEILSDGVPRGPSEITRIAATKYGLVDPSTWVDVYGAVQNDSRFASTSVGTQKRAKFCLANPDAVRAVAVSTPHTTVAPIAMNVPLDGGFGEIGGIDNDLADLMAA